MTRRRHSGAYEKHPRADACHYVVGGAQNGELLVTFLRCSKNIGALSDADETQRPLRRSRWRGVLISDAPS